MQDEYDLTGAKRATEIDVLNQLRTGKTRVTILLDNDLLEDLRARGEAEGIGYQAFIVHCLREKLISKPLDEEVLRRVLREEWRAFA